MGIAWGNHGAIRETRHDDPKLPGHGPGMVAPGNRENDCGGNGGAAIGMGAAYGGIVGLWHGDMAMDWAKENRAIARFPMVR